MGNKCKICGYRFRSKDEAICPECFTARDDDISCERYSASEHSHGRSYGGGLHETGESFVQKEMREERRNSFARENFGARANAGLDLSDDGSRFDQQSRFVRNDYNYGSANQYQQAMPQQSAYQRYIAQQQRKAGTASGYSSQTSGFTPAGQILAQRNPMRSSPQAYTPINTQRKKSSAGAVTFLVMFVFIAVAAVTISNIRDRQEERERESYNYTYTYTTRQRTTSKTTTAKTTTKKAVTTKLKNNKVVSSTMNHFSATLSEVTFEKKNKSEIDKALLNAAMNKSDDNEPWEVVTLKVKFTAGTQALADPRNTVIPTVTLQGLENADAHDTLSYSVDSPKTAIDITNDVETTFTLLVHKNAKRIYFSIFLKNSGMTEQCRFIINRE